MDGGIFSAVLRRAFGWDLPPRAAVVCAQLVQLAKAHTTAVSPDETFLWRSVLKPAYASRSHLGEVYSGGHSYSYGGAC
jgi:hypothetical protein